MMICLHDLRLPSMMMMLMIMIMIIMVIIVIMLIVIIEPSRTIILIISKNTSKYPIRCRSSVQFSSVQDGIYALGKVRMRSISSLRSFPKVTFKTVPMFV